RGASRGLLGGGRRGNVDTRHRPGEPNTGPTGVGSSMKWQGRRRIPYLPPSVFVRPLPTPGTGPGALPHRTPREPPMNDALTPSSLPIAVLGGGNLGAAIARGIVRSGFRAASGVALT